MTEIIVCANGINPYENDQDAREILPRAEVTHQGVLYTRHSYERPLGSLSRLLNIIQVIALSIITCFIALAFESVRKRWSEGIYGYENVIVLIPKKETVLIPKNDFLELPKDVISSIFSECGIQELGCLSAVSKKIQPIADSNEIWKKICDNSIIPSFDPNYDDQPIDNYKEYYRDHRLDKYRGNDKYSIKSLAGEYFEIDTSPDARVIHLKYFIKERPEFKDCSIDKMRIISEGILFQNDHNLKVNKSEGQFHLVIRGE